MALLWLLQFEPCHQHSLSHPEQEKKSYHYFIPYWLTYQPDEAFVRGELLPCLSFFDADCLFQNELRCSIPLVLLSSLSYAINWNSGQQHYESIIIPILWQYHVPFPQVCVALLCFYFIPDIVFINYVTKDKSLSLPCHDFLIGWWPASLQRLFLLFFLQY